MVTKPRPHPACWMVKKVEKLKTAVTHETQAPSSLLDGEEGCLATLRPHKLASLIHHPQGGWGLWDAGLGTLAGQPDSPSAKADGV